MTRHSSEQPRGDWADGGRCEWMYELYVDEVLPRGVKRAVGTIVVDARHDSRDQAWF